MWLGLMPSCLTPFVQSDHDAQVTALWQMLRADDYQLN